MKLDIDSKTCNHKYKNGTVFKCINDPRIDEDTGEWMVDVAM